MINVLEQSRFVVERMLCGGCLAGVVRMFCGHPLLVCVLSRCSVWLFGSCCAVSSNVVCWRCFECRVGMVNAFVWLLEGRLNVVLWLIDGCSNAVWRAFWFLLC